MKRLPMVWTKHLQDSEQQQQLEATLRSSKTAITRLREIIDEKERDLLASETSIKDFEDPNWSYKQAYKNGQRAGYRELRQLLDFI